MMVSWIKLILQQRDNHPTADRKLLELITSSVTRLTNDVEEMQGHYTLLKGYKQNAERLDRHEEMLLKKH